MFKFNEFSDILTLTAVTFEFDQPLACFQVTSKNRLLLQSLTN